MTTLSILPVRHSADLFNIYPNQSEPQACFIALDLCTGRMSAQTNPEIGNAVPMDVWHGLIRRYHLPGSPVAETANALLEDIASHAQIILDHAEVVWDGSNNVVHTHERTCEYAPWSGMAPATMWRCECPIAVAEQAIEAAIDSISEEDCISWAEAGEWYDSGVDEYVKRVLAGERIEAVAAFMQQEIEEEYKGTREYWIVSGIDAYLRMAVEQAQEKEVTADVDVYKAVALAEIEIAQASEVQA